ncbi:Replication gene A protein (GpA) [Xenorhabdus nematophila ATCC 19061]|uniref:Replication gene A protein (GpA) n=1 Tax=Xenorhabdus nematophila (strain ATCC 19061 / DSM 3370 / CCUG 14189 / LMG 1036 / NCIMB 9965 / AN6) TaxID=406817 RepID=D3V9L5_XENNA|nr:replication endonuclease [Xenorhabdus nematophila]CBJ89253.1 Replication gene A protein (GpA) [Xenorhabdus nematophila ATCC 19061]CEK22157.1 Replication gene A protein (GpA) [Xenorhabdus nematophila AN6/1]
MNSDSTTGKHNDNYLISKREQVVMSQQNIPQGVSMAERLLWEVNAEDHQWRHQYIGQMPDFLAKYFSRRYVDIFNRSGRRDANSFLRKTVGQNVLPRLQLAKKRYQFNHCISGIAPFPFIESLDNVATYTRKQLLKLAHEISVFISSNYEHYSSPECSQKHSSASADSENAQFSRVVRLYQLLAKLTLQCGTNPPYWQHFNHGRKPPSVDQLCSGMLRMMSARWWYFRLKRLRDIQSEHMAIAVGQVQQAASPYISRQALREWLEQKRRNREFFKHFDLENEEGERISLADTVVHSNANPAIRRCELMVRMRGFEEVANKMDCVGEFYTITAPAKYHAVQHQGGFVKYWDGATPRDTQHYLSGIWAKARAAIARAGINLFGFRVVEPHHDGTPHWHMVLFMMPEHLLQVRKILEHYACQEEQAELQRNEAKKARFDYRELDPDKGSATGYIAKYISKNIDGYALDDEIDHETGECLRDMAKSVTAWASRWRIRQFQQIGGAPVSVWRELRRLREISLSDDKINAVLQAADEGNWAAYTQAQGGPWVARCDLVIRLSYKHIPFGSPYGEDIHSVQGVTSPFLSRDEFICTRIHQWSIVPKSDYFVSEQVVDKGSIKFSSWSSVNNCTDEQVYHYGERISGITKNIRCH